jgi:hypothetical protein
MQRQLTDALGQSSRAGSRTPASMPGHINESIDISDVKSKRHAADMGKRGFHLPGWANEALSEANGQVSPYQLQNADRRA